MLDFRPDEKRALPAHRASDQIDGIDRDFPFRDARLPLLAPGLTSHHSHFIHILYLSYFIGLFEKRDNKNLRNKILKKCHPM